MNAPRPPALAQLQDRLQGYLIGGDNAILADVADARGETARRRLAIYGEAYLLRLVEVLATDFRALSAVLGADEFDRLGRAYARAHPSRFRSVRWFGSDFAAFVAATAPWGGRDELAELARFEWALSLCFDAADEAPLDIVAVAAVPPASWPGMRVRLHPSCRRLDLRGNAPQIRLALETDTPLPAAVLEPLPRGWLLWRLDDTPRFRSLTVDEAWALDAAAGGASFGEVCEGLLEWCDARNVAMHAASMLKTWLGDGLITALLVDDE